MKNISTYRLISKAVECVTGQHSKATLVQNDCLKFVKKLPDNCVDLLFSSPPYCMGKEYESSRDVTDFIEAHEALLPELIRILRPGGSLCWQVGNHVHNGIVTPLDALVYAEMLKHKEMQLRNRIIWSFSHGLHCNNRFSGRHETILWFSKGADYTFNLDAVRVPQKYPGKTHTKGPNKGKISGNPLGKNPGDVWDIPNVKANHIEKTDHPCQFPVALPQIFIRALTDKNAMVFDPFMGSGSTGVAALIEGRRFIGSEINPQYISIAENRIKNTLNGEMRIRPLHKEIYVPSPNEKVAKRPDEFPKIIDANGITLSMI